MLSQEFRWQGRVVRWGSSGSGPPVVFCHGTPWSSRLWRSVAQALASRCTVYLWDMPGFGQSSKDPGHQVSLDVQGELFADLLGHWGLTAPHVVTHDVGGAVALRAHLLRQVPYSSLALVDVVALSPWGSPFFTLVKAHADVLAALPPAIHLGALQAYVSGASHRGLTAEQLSWLTEPWTGEAGQPAFYRQIAQAEEGHTDEIEPLYPGLDLPVLLVWGVEDTWIPVDRAHRLHDLIPGARLRLVPDAGHLIQLDQPEALTATLGHWLDTQPSPRAGW